MLSHVELMYTNTHTHGTHTFENSWVYDVACISTDTQIEDALYKHID